MNPRYTQLVPWVIACAALVGLGVALRGYHERGVMLVELQTRYILGKPRYLLSNNDVRTAKRKIEAARLAPSKANLDRHVANIKRRIQTGA